MRLIVQMSGLDSLSLKVSYLINGARNGLKLSVPEAADLFVQEAKAMVPVDTGRLQEAIHAEVLEDAAERQVMQVAPFYAAGEGGQLSLGSQFGVVKSAADYGFEPAYARRIEYGFIGQDSLGRMYHQAAQPYMRPAYDAKRDEAAGVIKNGVYDSLNDAMNAVAARRNR